MRQSYVDLFEAKQEVAQVDALKRKHRAAAHKAFRDEVRKAPKKAAPSFINLIAPGAEFRAIFHDPRW